MLFRSAGQLRRTTHTRPAKLASAIAASRPRPVVGPVRSSTDENSTGASAEATSPGAASRPWSGQLTRPAAAAGSKSMTMASLGLTSRLMRSSSPPAQALDV